MWAGIEFGFELSGIHGRNINSLIRAAEKAFDSIGSSFSKAMGNSFRQAVAAIFSKKEMETDKMLKGHIQATVDRCTTSKAAVIVVGQDSTIYNLNSHHGLSGLGLIQGKLKGTLQHNVFAMDQYGTPLGLLYQRNWTRGGLHAFENEADKWQEGLQAVNAALGGTAKKVVLVQDREADIFRFFTSPRSSNVELVVRVFQPRQVEVMGQEKALALQQAAELLSAQGQMKTQIRRQNRPVNLQLEIKAGKVTVMAPKGSKEQPAKELYLVMARETAAFDEQGNDVFKADQAACWLLLTSCQVQTPEQAFEVVNWYALRWRVEQFHYVLKSGGFKVERLQFDDVHTFFNALAFYSIVAWRVLYLTYLAREQPQAPAEEHFEELEMKVLQAKHKEPIKTIEEAVLALGKLVNFQKTKRQPLPGAKLLGEALVKLQNMIEGYKIFEQLSQNQDFSLQD